MIELSEQATIPEIFFRISQTFAKAPFLIIPKNSSRSYDTEGRELSFAECAEMVRDLMGRYSAAGYGVGHRVGLLLENRPEHFLHKLAMNALGICCVPLNPDNRPAEIAYVINHSKLDLVIVVEQLQDLLIRAQQIATHQIKMALLSNTRPFPRAKLAASSTTPNSQSIASILYTSGTTGKPKGCLISHRYELAAGHWYVNRGGLATFREGCERIYNPLPVFHVNAGVLSFFGAMISGNCQVQSDRFHPQRWIQEIHETQATVVHYLGVVVPMLLNQPLHPLERNHQVRFAIGAGVDPQRHQEYETRFGYPLIEIWGMTEMVRLIFDADEPRQIGTRAFGRPMPGLEVIVANEFNQELPRGVQGEMLIRYSQADPRKDFFSGYLDDELATEQAWRGGWFHTGDIVTQDPDGLLHFVDRRKNIIRRSGENIAAAEVEAVLQAHPMVFQAAVLSLPDEVREEEVLACIVLKSEYLQNDILGLEHPIVKEIFDYCNQQLAYFKVPGWIFFTDHIPTTGTQKINKHQIFHNNQDPKEHPGMLDVREWKKRRAV
jgi:crotonobetaine/carnitine-CoA ligase